MVLLKTIREYWLKRRVFRTIYNSQTCYFSGCFLISGFCTNLPLPQIFLEIWEVATKERSSLYCDQTSSFLFVGMWRVCKSSKIKHSGGWGGLCSLDQRETQAHYLFFRIPPLYSTDSFYTWCHCKQSLRILVTMQSYKSYYMVSLQTVFTYPFHYTKLQILLHGVTANSLYLSLSLYKATNLTTWCHCKQSLLIPFTIQSYKSYYMVSLQTVFTYPFHYTKLQILLHGVTANSHCKQSLLMPFTLSLIPYSLMIFAWCELYKFYIILLSTECLYSTEIKLALIKKILRLIIIFSVLHEWSVL